MNGDIPLPKSSQDTRTTNSREEEKEERGKKGIFL
jgi:hypothetical protein